MQEFLLTDKIIAYESGELSEEEAIELFQHLIDTGMAWTLQGHYGRTAKALVDAGLCTIRENNHFKLTAKELDEKFDKDEEDIIDYFEVVKDDGLPKP